MATDMEHGRWEHFEHQADIGIRAVAPSREQLFECLGEALTAIVTDPDEIRALQTVAISCEAPDDEMLLVDWLNALIFEMATRRMLFGGFNVELEGKKLSATVIGETVDRTRHQPVVEVKGATYTALRVEQDGTGNWHGQCVVDV